MSDYADMRLKLEADIREAVERYGDGSEPDIHQVSDWLRRLREDRESEQ